MKLCQRINKKLYRLVIQYVCMYLKYMYLCIRINPTVIGKECKNKSIFRAKYVYLCMTVSICKYMLVLVYLCVYASACIYVSEYKNKSYCNRQRMWEQNVSSELNMYIDVWLYQPINICLHWRIYVCMYRLEYMYQCVRINPTVIGKECKNKMYLQN
jgi:4-hydroxy-3-methylbut-2-en-1-yl diphosphate synthase IspG/GcpE